MKLDFSSIPILALALSPLVAHAQLSISSGATVNWGTQSDVGIGTSQGVELAVGWLVRIGTFSLTDQQIRDNQHDYTILNGAFTQYDTASIGLVLVEGQPPVAGLWSKSSSISTDALGIDGDRIYLWAFNAAAAQSATEHGIFTHSGWTFPADNSIPSSISIDLAQVVHDASELIVGGYGTGITTGTENPLYNLAAVPEPASTAAVVAGACLLGVAARRTLFGRSSSRRI